MKRVFSHSALVGLGFCFAQNALAANMPLPPAAPPPPPPLNWNGFYIGADANILWNDSTTFTASDPSNSFGPFLFPFPGLGPGPTSFSASDIGWALGPHLGYNLQLGSFLLGVEGDIDWGVLSMSKQQPLVNSAGQPLGGAGGFPFNAGTANAFTSKLDVNSLSSVRGRAGWIWHSSASPPGTAAWPSIWEPRGLIPSLDAVGDFLLYGTGGVGWAQEHWTANLSCPGILINGGNNIGGNCFSPITGPTSLQAPISVNSTKAGVVFGGGLEWMPQVANGKIIWGIEYLHYSFKGLTATGLTANAITGGAVCGAACIPYTTGHLDINDVRWRVTYKWN